MASSSTTYYHLVPEAQWQDCKDTGKAYFPTTYEQDGFTHLSDNKEVLITIGNHFYKQIQGLYLVLEIDSSRLESKVKLEPAAPVGDTKPHFDGNEQLFPHLYGPINVGSVANELKVQRSDDGSFLKLLD